MDPRRYQQVKAILVEALELPASERSGFVRTTCGDDAALRAEVESLLAYEAQEDFLEPLIPSAHFPDVEGDSHGAADTSAFDPLVGRTFSQYRVTRRLGGGGMGVVYLAEDLRLGRRAALKFLKPQSVFDEGAEARFTREARAVAALDHPNICTLYSIEHTDEGQIFLAMAYYEGETLKQRLARGPISINACVEIARHVGQGLAAAHASGIIHRDIKPGNIMLGDGFVKVLDFGIAKLTDQVGLTIPGMSLGTAAYASPEQVQGVSVDHRTDIWALGVVTHEMLAGRRPFDADRAAGQSFAERFSQPLRLRDSRPDVPEALDALVRRALSFNPADRYQTMRELVAAFERVRPVRELAAPVTITTSSRAAERDDRLLTVHTLTDALDRAQFAEYDAGAVRHAIERLEQSIDAVPGEALTYAALVEACVWMFDHEGPAQREQFATKARNALTKGLALDAAAPDVQFAAAEVAFRIDWLPRDAEVILKRILSTHPDHRRAGLRLAECLITTGNTDEAGRLALEAGRRDPASPGTLVRAGRVLHFAREYLASVRLFGRARDADPGSFVASLDLALTLAKTHEPDRACVECDRALASPAARALAVAAIGNASRASGNADRYASARRLLARLADEVTVSPRYVELLDASFGRTGRPLEYLERYDESSGLAMFLGLAPVNGSLSAFVDSVGLIAYFGIDPAFGCLYEARSFRVILERLDRHAS